MRKPDHPQTVEKYDGSLEQLAEDIGDLQYDGLIEFFGHLEDKFKKDAKNGGSTRLAEFLTYASVEIKSAKKQVWRASNVVKEMG